MRKRVLGTTKILSVAVAVLPACEKPVVHADPTPAPSVSAPVSASVVARPEPTISPSATLPPKPELLALAGELLGADPAKIDAAHYRPLCDDKGYPLVGNLTTKDPKASGTLVSQFCATVRKKP